MHADLYPPLNLTTCHAGWYSEARTTPTKWGMCLHLNPPGYGALGGFTARGDKGWLKVWVKITHVLMPEQGRR